MPEQEKTIIPYDAQHMGLVQLPPGMVTPSSLMYCPGWKDDVGARHFDVGGDITKEENGATIYRRRGCSVSGEHTQCPAFEEGICEAVVSNFIGQKRADGPQNILCGKIE
jgi:hypothetical protein